MRFRKLVALVIFAAMLLSACGASASLDVADINSPASLLDLPDELSIEFEEGVTQREKDVVNFTVGLIQKEFERLGLQFTSNIFIASDRETYFDKRVAHRAKMFGEETEEIKEQYREEFKEYSDGRLGMTSKGVAQPTTGDIFINLDLIRLLDTENDALNKDSRDVSLAYVLIHESYHVLQGRLMLGWKDALLQEISANVFAEKLLMQSQCEYYGGMEKLSLATVDCEQSSVEEGLVAVYESRYLSKEQNLNAIMAYIIENYGSDVLNAYYSNLGKCADENSFGANMDIKEAYSKQLNEYWEKCFADSLEKTFGMTLDEFEEAANSYAEKLKEK